MRGRPIKAAILSLVVIGLTGCTSLANMDRQEKPDVIIRAGKVYEECLEVNPPQVVDYSFSASKPLEFNIHYHGERAIYPVVGQDVRTWQGVFDPTCIHNYSAEKPPFFCLMWTNPHEEDVGLYFEYSVRDKE